MSFRRVGGLNYSSKHNYVSSSNNATGNLLISENVGLLNTCIHFESNIDASFCGPTGSSGSGATGPTGPSGPTGPTGTIGTPSLSNTSVNFTSINIGAVGPNTAVFPETLTILSAGKWLISAQVTLQYVSSMTLPTNSGGWNVAFVGAAAGGIQTGQNYSITTPAGPAGIFIYTIPSGIAVFDNTLVYPYAVQLQVYIVSSSFGVNATGSATALRVADL
jgi:hypothetical protein